MGAGKKRKHGSKRTVIDVQQGRYDEPAEACRHSLPAVKGFDRDRGIYNLWICLMPAKRLKARGTCRPVARYWTGLLRISPAKEGYPGTRSRLIHWTCGPLAVFCRRPAGITHLSPGRT